MTSRRPARPAAEQAAALPAPRQRRWRRVFSARNRSLMSLGAIGFLAVGLGAQGTFAFWTDQAKVETGTFSSGTLDVTLNGALAGPANNGGSISFPGFSLNTMVPGESQAQSFPIANAGTVGLTYTINGTATGALAPAMLFEVHLGNASNSGTAAAAEPDRRLLRHHAGAVPGPRRHGLRHDRHPPGDGGRGLRDRLRRRQAQPRRRQHHAGQVHVRHDHLQRQAGDRSVSLSARLRDASLWVGAVLGLLSMVAAVAVMFFGYTFLIFRSGSMGPDIPTGSFALAHRTAAADLRVGDVVSVIAEDGARITHRIEATTLRGDEASLVLRGDANKTVRRRDLRRPRGARRGGLGAVPGLRRHRA